MTIRLRKFGSLEFEAFPIAFGGAAVSGEGGGYGFGGIGEKESVDLLHAAHDAGINVFDTAPIYGFGTSERRFGKAFEGRRDKIFLVSKCGVSWNDDKKVAIDNSPETTRRMLEQSLKDLRTDYLDLYFVHWPDENVDIRETMKVLARAKQEGKIRAIGLSNFLEPADIQKAMEVERVDVLQAQFNLFNDEPARKTFPFALEQGMGFMSWGTFDQGVLTGRVTRERKFEKSDFRAGSIWKKNEAKFRAMDRLRPLLERHGVDGRSLALGFVLSYDALSVALCGVKSREQLDTALKALENPPPKELIGSAVQIAREELGAEVSSG